MERDALLAHGTSFLLQDRLMNCSDYSTAWVCRTCGSLISLGFDDGGMSGVQTVDARNHSSGGAPGQALGPNGEYCMVCRAEDEERVHAGEEPLAEGRRVPLSGVRIPVPGENVVRRGRGDLDVVAIP